MRLWKIPEISGKLLGSKCNAFNVDIMENSAADCKHVSD